MAHLCADDIKIEDVMIEQQRMEEKVTVTVTVTLNKPIDKMYKVSMTLSPAWRNGKKIPATEIIAKTAIITAGKESVTMDILVEKPKCWSLEETEDRYQYALQINLKPGGTSGGGKAAVAITKVEPIDSRELTIGLM